MSLEKNVANHMFRLEKSHAIPLFFKLVGSFPAFVLASPASEIGSQETKTQLTRGYISRLNRLLITQIIMFELTLEKAQLSKYSMENMNFFILYKESISDTFASMSNAFSAELCLLLRRKRAREEEWLKAIERLILRTII